MKYELKFLFQKRHIHTEIVINIRIVFSKKATKISKISSIFVAFLVNMSYKNT